MINRILRLVLNEAPVHPARLENPKSICKPRDYEFSQTRRTKLEPHSTLT